MESDFRQEYQVGSKSPQKVTLYCRMCRRRFPVTVPGNPNLKVRCRCGHEAPLYEIDVFSVPERAVDFAAFYERVMAAVESALGDSDLPFQVDLKPNEDSELPADAYNINLTRFKGHIDQSADVVERHRWLGEAIEYCFVQRQNAHQAAADCEKFCLADIELIPELVGIAKREKQAGRQFRLTFGCFSHLIKLYEEKQRFADALRYAEMAVRVGLKTYQDRVNALRSKL